MSAPSATIGRRPPPRRGVPYYDVATGRTLILPPKGGKAVEYVRSPPEPFSPAKALRRAGVRAAGAADQGARRATSSATRTARAELPTFGRSDTGWGGLLVYVFLSLIGLALLHNALGGRGPAAVGKLFGFLGAGINRLVSPIDPIVGKGTLPASTPATAPSSSSSSAAARTSGGSRGVGLLRGLAGVTVIGLPGQGTHSRSEGPNNWQSDNAVDLRAPIGTPVTAPVAGVVIKAGYLPGVAAGETSRFAGQRVTIQGAGNEFYFAHLSKVAVRVGQRVQAGQLLGQSGAANGVPHLHFAVQTGSPLDWLFAPKGGNR
ncbi:MAG TPA: M23 family metallopeptidase [Gaiellaceae bacterium]|jgi:biotin carboxyl carrier protein